VASLWQVCNKKNNITKKQFINHGKLVFIKKIVDKNILNKWKNGKMEK
jgi:hypothetical protein